MNILTGCTRIGLGVLAGPILFLLASTILHQPMGLNLDLQTGAAVVGLVGGFAERNSSEHFASDGEPNTVASWHASAGCKNEGNGARCCPQAC